MKIEEVKPCFWGAYCSHAILTMNLGVYHCPFGICFKRKKEQKQ